MPQGTAEQMLPKFEFEFKHLICVIFAIPPSIRCLQYVSGILPERLFLCVHFTARSDLPKLCARIYSPGSTKCNLYSKNTHSFGISFNQFEMWAGIFSDLYLITK